MAKKKAKKSDANEGNTADAAPSGPRMFEYHDAKSDKFWCIELSDNAHTVRYGRVGTDGQSKTKEFADAAKAQASYEKLIGQKVKKGYVEILDQASSRSESVKLNRAKAQEREPFLKEILASPDDPAPYFVFADWLEEQGDPQGEFIRVQWQLEDKTIKGPERNKLKKREKQLIAEHSRTWLSDLADDLLDQTESEDSWRGKPYTFEFARGFLDSLTISFLLPKFGKKLGRSPSASMLRRLVIRDPSNGDELMEMPEYEGENWDYEDTPGLDALIGGKLTNLRYLEIAEDGGCHISAPNIHRVVKTMPHLEELLLEAHDVDTSQLFKVKFQELRSLTVHHLSGYDLVTLANNKSLGKLETIYFWPHALDYDDDAYIDLEGFQAICRSKNFPSLKNLALWSSSIGDQGINELVQSPLLGQLKTLDLTYGSITQAGAEVLANADLSGIESLILTSNFLNDQGIARLKSACKNFDSASQFAGSPEDNEEYLCYGDME